MNMIPKICLGSDRGGFHLDNLDDFLPAGDKPAYSVHSAGRSTALSHGVP